MLSVTAQPEYFAALEQYGVCVVLVEAMDLFLPDSRQRGQLIELRSVDEARRVRVRLQGVQEHGTQCLLICARLSF